MAEYASTKDSGIERIGAIPAQAAYIENMAAYEQLFMDADKYRIIQKALAERLYQELHNQSK